MFEFEGDTFNATAVVAIVVEDEMVIIFTYGMDEGFEYEFGDGSAAVEAAARAVAAWRAAAGIPNTLIDT